MHHEYMNHRDDVELGTKLLPAVDLTLWVQIVLAAVLVLLVAGLALALS